jgi:hypothetical protein
MQYVETAPSSPFEAWADIVWAIVNSHEFQFIH